MPKIIISGCCGRMGRVIAGLCAEDPEITVAAGCDIVAQKYADFPVYSDLMEFGGTADALIDFSNPASLDGILSYCLAKKLPVVLCTTGYSEAQLDKIRDASEKIPVFKSANMSVGINLLAELVKKSAALLYPGFDVEIIEKHHNQKLDAPSGTALLLADAAADAMGDVEYVYGRHERRETRPAAEIGISSIRGGTMPGEHSVIFAGPDEVIELKHTVFSRSVFASGAVRAAKYMAGKTKPGIYDMSDVIA